MNEKICCFCGHREILDAGIEKRVRSAVMELIRDGFTEFYSGGMGEFDKICERAVRVLKHDCDKIKLNLVLPYMSARINNDREQYAALYDEIIVPDLGSIHYKRAITARNRWMADRADAVLAYICRNYGGAYVMFDYANKIEKRIINLGALPTVR